METKKDFLKRNHGLRAEFYVVCPQIRDNCSKCPFFVKDSERFCTVNDDENRGIMAEAWIERQRYIKLPEIPEGIYANIEAQNRKVETISVKASDPINPSHYRHGEMQTIERIMMMLGPIKVEAFCEANAVKYLDRSGYKGDACIEKIFKERGREEWKRFKSKRIRKSLIFVHQSHRFDTSTTQPLFKSNMGSQSD